jgi:hypothetical protein
MLWEIREIVNGSISLVNGLDPAASTSSAASRTLIE